MCSILSCTPREQASNYPDTKDREGGENPKRFVK